MKVSRLHGDRDLRLHEEPMPVPQDGEALVRVTAVGICGSDLHWFSEGGIGDSQLLHPLVLGHEFAGIVEHGRLAGQLVAVDPAIACGKCEFCLEGNPNFCVNMRFAGHAENDGALREYVAWPEHCLFALPEPLNASDGAMLEALGVALHAADLGKVRLGDRVGEFGCGPIGLLILQLVAAAGASQIIAADRLQHRLDEALAYKASDGFLVENEPERAMEFNKVVWKAADRRGVDVAFEVAGDNEAVEAAIAAAKPGGKVILVGIPSEDRTAFIASVARRKGLTIKMVRRMKNTYPRAIRLVAQGTVDVRSIVSAHYALDQANEAFAMAVKREGLKIMIHPSQ